MTITVRVAVNGTSHRAKCTLGTQEPVFVVGGDERLFTPYAGESLIVEEVEAEGGATASSGGGGHDTPPAASA